MTARSWLWLCCPVVTLSTFDLLLTLVGQSPQYWAGDRLAAREANPVALKCLHYHPLALVAFAAAGMAGLCALMGLLPARLAAVLGFFSVLVRAGAAAGWLSTYGIWGWAAAVGVLVGAERLLSWSWARAGLRPCVSTG